MGAAAADLASLDISLADDRVEERTQVFETLDRDAFEPGGDRRKLARLVVLAGSKAGTRYTVGAELVIGRSASAHLTIEGADVSRRHARITRRDATFVIEDLGSRNGTMVNGTPIDRCTLRFGDAVKVGQKNTFLFTHHSASEDQLRSQQRLGAAFELAKGVAHNFNNAMATVMFQLSFLKSVGPKTELGDTDVAASIEEMDSALRHLAGLTRQLMDFARLPKEQEAPVDLAGVVSEVLDELVEIHGPTVNVKASIDPTANLTIRGDLDRIYRALAALCRDASGVDGSGLALPSLRVVVSERAVDQAAAVSSGLPPGGYAVIRISGAGLAAKITSDHKIFDPFRDGEDGGVPEERLELASALGIVQDHGGVVLVGKTEGSVAVNEFTVHLPLG